jgi:1-acyl-sn-glycerol-3-phosphate acyltransferase
MQMAADVVQKRGISLLIFPEGGRSHNGVMQPFKEGAAYIAIRAGVPIVPAALIGTHKILPYGSGTPLPGTVTLRIMKPIETSGMSLKDRHALTERVHALILQAMNGEAG